MDIVLKPKRVAGFFASMAICLILAHIASQAFDYCFGRSLGLSLFDLDEESNIPTFYSSIALLFCSILLSLIAFVKKREDRIECLYWLGLAIVFLFLAVDESAALHERLSKPIQAALGTSGVLYYAWVIPYGILVGVLLLAYIKFIIKLPTSTRRLFILAGSIYVAGALGVQLVGNYQVVSYGKNTTFFVLSMIEEILEMSGIVVFIYALVSYISAELKGLLLRVSFEEPMPRILEHGRDE